MIIFCFVSVSTRFVIVKGAFTIINGYEWNTNLTNSQSPQYIQLSDELAAQVSLLLNIRMISLQVVM